MSQEHTRAEPEDKHPEVAGEEIMEAARIARDTVIRQMLNSRYSRYVDDIYGETVKAAWVGVTKGAYDPEKAPLTAWVKAIARHKTLDLLRAIKRRSTWQGESLMTSTEQKTADQRMEEALNDQTRGEPDHAELYAEIEADRVWLKPLLSVTVQVLDERKFFNAYLVYFKYHGSIADAAEHLDASEDQLRKAVRQLRLHMQVISNAMVAQRNGARGTVRDLINCLPSDGEAGAHMRRIAQAIEAWTLTGEVIGTVTQDFICEHTGFSHNTVRQRIKDVLILLRVAYTVITRVPVEEYAAEKEQAA